QQAIQEGRDGRQLVLDAVRIGELQSGRVLERLKRAVSDLAGDQQQVQLTQGIAGVMTFEIVLGAEQALPAGLALASGDGSQGVEASRNGREEALLGFYIGRDGSEQRRLGLIGAVGPAQSLYGGIRLPSGFQEVVGAQA